MMHYVGTGITPAMTHAAVGVGSQYAYTAEDATGAWLDGAKNYTLTLPAPIPAKTFWAIDIYDTQTRSLLQTDNPYPSINNRFAHLTPKTTATPSSASGPTPTRARRNWLRPIPGKSWFPILRLYGPLDPGSTRPGDPEKSNPTNENRATTTDHATGKMQTATLRRRRIRTTWLPANDPGAIANKTICARVGASAQGVIGSDPGWCGRSLGSHRSCSRELQRVAGEAAGLLRESSGRHPGVIRGARGSYRRIADGDWARSGSHLARMPGRRG